MAGQYTLPASIQERKVFDGKQKQPPATLLKRDFGTGVFL